MTLWAIRHVALEKPSSAHGLSTSSSHWPYVASSLWLSWLMCPPLSTPLAVFYTPVVFHNAIWPLPMSDSHKEKLLLILSSSSHVFQLHCLYSCCSLFLDFHRLQIIPPTTVVSIYVLEFHPSFMSISFKVSFLSISKESSLPALWLLIGLSWPVPFVTYFITVVVMI